MEIAALIAILSGLFATIALTEPLADRLRLPFSVILAALGLGIGLAAAWFWATPLTDVLNPVALAILNLPISSEVFLYAFLPTLIFQMALTINLRRMLDDWVPIVTLAVVAVAVATGVIALALQPISGLSLIACLLIGSIVSTTDPSAVVTIFRATPAPQRLARIVEGESLLNDAAAIALFGVFLGDVVARAVTPDVASAIVEFPFMIVVGALVGALAGRLAVGAMAWLNGWSLAQITLSVALPYSTFLFADKVMGASGVVAVVVAGMVVNFTAPGRLSPGALDQLREAWGLLAHWAGALIFVFAALMIPGLLSDMRWGDLWLIAATVVAALTARALILYAVMPLLTLARLSPRVEPPYRVAILWGGLRGAVTLALALAVTESPGVPPEVKRQVAIVATGFTLFTLLVQGTTLRLLIGWLGLDRLSPLDRALSDQVVAVALQSVQETVAETTRNLDIEPDALRKEATAYRARLDAAVARADAARDILDKDRVTLGMVALAGHERDVILEAFHEDLLPARLAEPLLADADRLIEATRTDGRAGYRAQTRRSLRPGRVLRFAATLYARTGIAGPLERSTEDRFEKLVAQSQILRALHRFIEARILRIHGRRVASVLHDLLNRRIEDTGRELEGLRLQFPGYSDELERRLIRRITLQQEIREYDQLTEDGLIGPELRLALRAETAQARLALQTRARLDLALQKSDLVQGFPLFASLDDAARARLTAQLGTLYAAPGDVLMRPEEPPKKVWFIASGAVEAVQEGKSTLLGRGEMFGQLSVILRSPRRAEVTAVTHCILLTLEDGPFLAMLQDNAAIIAAVKESAAKRGVTVEDGLDRARLSESPFLQKLRQGLRAAR